ncbi:uncharacterized protein A4U43_C03F26490 [Asparagus officinalis]|uniref:Uncharacterized protein n=1 Tax=Asparagus officinalis TaxID=4686 RepID=A0A5P1FDZ7_ASPOF|nr:protein PHLOEM PROTEIN 2-LIKE A1-like [Asparagus officinalis]ONK76332.1 uncharacterized protein A4U43_C03F26490 [Asparagus officinalis]
MATVAKELPKVYTENSWMEERNGDRGMLKYPRELDITNVDDGKSWVWHSLVFGSIGRLGMEAPKLMGTTHVEIRGDFKMSKLTPGLKYQAVLLCMKTNGNEGWDSCPLNVELNLPDGTTQKRKVDLTKFPTDEFVMMVLGYFEAVESGDITFSVVDTSNCVKKGFVVKDAALRPLPR